jgi:hypothetical protein
MADPLNRTLSVYRLGADGYILDASVGERGRARLRPFDSVELELDARADGPRARAAQSCAARGAVCRGGASPLP